MIFLIACSLAFDAFVVAVSYGVILPHFSQFLKLGWIFGVFQCLMSLSGFLIGTELSRYIQSFDHWIAFFLLASLGTNMVIDGITHSTQAPASMPTQLTPLRLLTLGIATSIDALAVGVSMAFIPQVSILPSCLLIGIVAFSFTLIGGLIGRRLGKLFQQRAEFLGGFVLIGIGVNILAEHLI